METLEIDTKLNPETLQTLACDQVVLHLDNISNNKAGVRHLKDTVPFLPESITQGLFNAYKEEGFTLTDEFAHLFKDVSRCRVTSIDLRNSLVTDAGLEWFCQHPIRTLDVSGVRQLSTAVLSKCIVKVTPTLERLVVGDRAKVLFNEYVRRAKKRKEDEANGIFDNSHIDPSNALPRYGLTDTLYCLSKSDHLRIISFHSLTSSDVGPVAGYFLSLLKNIQVIDLSCSSSVAGDDADLKHLEDLKDLPHLSSLILHHVLPEAADINRYLPVLTSLKSLRHLDISCVPATVYSGTYPSVQSQDKGLKTLFKELPSLSSLDISGTHLAGIDYVELTEDCKTTIPIPALRSHSLEFLGLLNCIGNPCKLPNLPATKVSGDHNIEQVMESLRRYQSRPAYCKDALNALYHFLRNTNFDGDTRTELLRLVLEAMRLHMDMVDKQIVGSAALFYLIKSDSGKSTLHAYASARMVRRAVRVIYDAMTTHSTDKAMLRNGLLTLCHFNIPEDVWFMYNDVVAMLMTILKGSDVQHDLFLQRISLYILNGLLRGSQFVDKNAVGDLGAVKTMLWLIDAKLRYDHADEVLDLCWSMLWNVTDETEENCSRFIEGEGYEVPPGLELFKRCYDKFCKLDPQDPQEVVKVKDGLLRNMMGVLGNVSEVRKLRPKIAQPTYLKLVSKFLDSESDGMEVSYHSAGIICHILSDNPNISIWSRAHSDVESPHADIDPSELMPIDSSGDEEMNDVVLQDSYFNSKMEEEQQTSDSKGVNAKQEVLEALERAINRWDLNCERSINYRSFTPILALLKCEHTVQVRHWGTWALCNLTNVYPKKYCPLLTEEGGIEILKDILSKPDRQSPIVMQLAKKVLDTCDKNSTSSGTAS